MTKILVVEDDPDTLEMIFETLKFENYVVEKVSDGGEARILLRTKGYDLAILDWELPTVKGLELCKDHRKNGGRIPILMLTGKDKTVDKIAGLDSGADDYLTKPFNVKELLARVRALLRRGESISVAGELTVEDVVLEPQDFRVTKSGVEIKLLPKEFAILELFMRYRGRVFSAEAILDRVWENEERPVVDVVRTHIMNLRKKIDGESFIETVHGIGYRIPKGKASE